MTKIIQLFTAFLFLSCLAIAQSNSGDIRGRVTDEKKAGLDFATVTASEGGIVKGGSKTDINGNYKIKPLAPGKYDIKVSYVGYRERIITGVFVGVDKSVVLDIELEKKENASATKKDVVVTAYKVKLIDASDPGHKVQTGETFRNSSSNKIGDLLSTQTGVFQSRSGSQELNIGGGRSSNTVYIIDGMKIRGGRSVGMPQNSLSQVELMTNGVSAKYGDATGGLVVITTNGVTSQLKGSLQLQHSIDGYNNNQASLAISGPLFAKKKKGGQKVPLVGYSLNIGVNFDKDGDPSYNGYTRLKPDVMKRLQDNPLIPNPTGVGNFVRASEQVTDKDFENIKAKENAENLGITYNGKLDFQPLENVNVAIGTSATYSKRHDFSFDNSLFAPEANQLEKDLNLRGFVRLTQKLGKSSQSEKQELKKSAISDAYYSLQFTYQKDIIDRQNPNHGKNIFDYGYNGKFKQYSHRDYQYVNEKGERDAIKYKGLKLDSVTYTPGGVNPILENYTKTIFNSDLKMTSLFDVLSNGGLLNGLFPGQLRSYDLFSGTGAQPFRYQKGDGDQVELNLDASLDIEQGAKNKKRKDPITHNIQFGLGYEQRTSRSYILVPDLLWNIMRQNTNFHFSQLDKTNPHYLIGGVTYTEQDLIDGVAVLSQFDTINYDHLYVGSEQTRIDKQLRQKLYGDDKNMTVIDVDNLDPKTFTLDMFSADDLLNGGQDVVFYSGYDYLGKKLKRQPSFNDFWTKKDARGDFERPIAAFRPIYMYGYLLDKFSYKDLNFNIGVRIDRYDANQKVLKDAYSLYGVRKVGDILNGNNKYSTSQDIDGSGTQAPSLDGINKDYVVYVDNNQSTTPKVVGFRKGDTWYDPFGKEISDPTILSADYNNGIPIEPWLVTKIDSTNDIKGVNFSPNNSFEDFKPQVALSPRIQFAFPISDNALFYGNYDVMTQGPAGNISGTLAQGINAPGPDDYYFLYERQDVIQNANLKMEKAIKYSLGYQQRLSKRSAVTLETFYIENKNKVQQQNFLMAYPGTYSSYGNRDFQSTKGLTVKFDFRRNGPIKMNIDYTMQFAEGTGSSTTSQKSLLATGQPNLRSVQALDYDSRHILNVNFDYRYDDDKNKGPEMWGKHPLQNAGLNLILRTHSGTPYTRASAAYALTGGDFNSKPITGTINGSRIGWVYDLGLRLDKSFSLGYYGAVKDKEGLVIKNGRPLYLNIYTNVQNLLNTQNTVGVHRYTGVGDDDGFLTSPQGLQALENIQFQQSYKDQYNIKVLNPDKYNAPRRINVGLSLEF